MALVRHPALRRALALLLLAGTLAGLSPAAAARSGHAQALERVLGDASAVEKALAAAISASTPQDFVDAFVSAYLRAVGADADYPRDAIAALLSGHVFGLMEEGGTSRAVVLPAEGPPARPVHVLPATPSPEGEARFAFPAGAAPSNEAALPVKCPAPLALRARAP